MSCEPLSPPGSWLGRRAAPARPPRAKPQVPRPVGAGLAGAPCPRATLLTLPVPHGAAMGRRRRAAAPPFRPPQALPFPPRSLRRFPQERNRRERGSPPPPSPQPPATDRCCVRVRGEPPPSAVELPPGAGRREPRPAGAGCSAAPPRWKEIRREGGSPAAPVTPPGRSLVPRPCGESASGCPPVPPLRRRRQGGSRRRHSPVPAVTSAPCPVPCTPRRFPSLSCACSPGSRAAAARPPYGQ